MAGRDLYTNEAIAALGIREPDRLDRSYLRYFLEAFDWDKATDGDHKIKGKTLNKAKLKEISVLVPPLPEQRRIVAILDEAFEGIATAKANAEKNLQNARELADALTEKLLRSPHHDRFVSRDLASLCEFIRELRAQDGANARRGLPFHQDPKFGKGKLILDDVNRVSEETFAAWTRRAMPTSGDLILAREAPAGNVAVVPEGMQVCLGQRTVLIRPRRDVFEPKFLAASSATAQ